MPTAAAWRERPIMIRIVHLPGAGIDQRIVARIQALFPDDAGTIEIVQKPPLLKRSCSAFLRSAGQLLRWVRCGHPDYLVYAVDRTDRQTILPVTLLLTASRATHGKYIADMNGYVRRVSSVKFLLCDLWEFIALILLSTSRTLGALLWIRSTLHPPRTQSPRYFCCKQVLYLRTDVYPNRNAGGAYTHTAGVISAFQTSGIRVMAVANAEIDLPCQMVPVRQIPFLVPFASYELHSLVQGRVFTREAARVSRNFHPDFVYQRHSLNNISGAVIAARHNVPLVLEYNGSEAWISQHWGTGLLFPNLALWLENVNLTRADLVVVVSNVLKNELLSRGIPEHRVLVNPNGVNTEQFSPSTDGSHIRKQYGIGDEVLFGFIGSFGPWHGTTQMAEAAVLCYRRNPAMLQSTRFLFVGDGVEMPAVRAITAQSPANRIILTGSVPHEQAAQYLAACDVLVSPHLPNADGSRFFGSPTKLFEYMAAGKAIIASRIEQIEEILQDGVSAVLVTPGSVEELANAMERIAFAPELRRTLGANARATAVAKHTWKHRADRLISVLSGTARVT